MSSVLEPPQRVVVEIIALEYRGRSLPDVFLFPTNGYSCNQYNSTKNASFCVDWDMPGSSKAQTSPPVYLNGVEDKAVMRSRLRAPQHLRSSRMASLGMLLGLLVTSWFTSCLSCQNSKNFALISTEKSIHKESETKETGEEELDTEVLEVFQPTQEWQALRPGQAVPAGSHVRMNLQTGAREVKLHQEDKFQNSLKGFKKGK
ncbi:hypothetical protein STEG23_022700, partial [Scotinomys teguina]